MDKIYEETMQEWSATYFQVILDNPDKDWDWYELSKNPNITWEIVQQHPDKPWNWSALSRNPRVTTWEFVQKNPDNPWDWYELSSNPNITWEIIQQHPDKPWNWYYLSCNPNITWEFVQQNPDKPWNWHNLSCNTFKFYHQYYMQNHLAKKAAKWFIKSDLKRELMERMWHPKNLGKLQCDWGHDVFEE